MLTLFHHKVIFLQIFLLLQIVISVIQTQPASFNDQTKQQRVAIDIDVSQLSQNDVTWKPELIIKLINRHDNSTICEGNILDSKKQLNCQIPIRQIRRGQNDFYVMIYNPTTTRVEATLDASFFIEDDLLQSYKRQEEYIEFISNMRKRMLPILITSTLAAYFTYTFNPEHNKEVKQLLLLPVLNFFTDDDNDSHDDGSVGGGNQKKKKTNSKSSLSMNNKKSATKNRVVTVTKLSKTKVLTPPPPSAISSTTASSFPFQGSSTSSTVLLTQSPKITSKTQQSQSKVSSSKAIEPITATASVSSTVSGTSASADTDRLTIRGVSINKNILKYIIVVMGGILGLLFNKNKSPSVAVAVAVPSVPSSQQKQQQSHSQPMMKIINKRIVKYQRQQRPIDVDYETNENTSILRAFNNAIWSKLLGRKN